MLGKSLITGNGFKYMDIPHTKYPFMFPLMLSPIIGLSGLNFFLMRLLIVIMGIGSIGLTYWVFRREFGSAFGFGIMIMTAASYPLMFECTRILSDVPYMFLSLLSLVFIKSYTLDKKWNGKYGYISAILLLATFLTRYIGAALFAGTLLYLILQRGSVLSLRLKKIAFICIIFLIPASIWMARGALIRHFDPHPQNLREFLSYEKELVVVSADNPHSQIVGLSNLVARVKFNGEYYKNLMANIVSGKPNKSKILIDIINAALLVGFIYSLVRWRGIFEYYVFFYVLIYILWTSLQGERFLVPIIPFIFYYVVRGLWLIIDSLIFLISRLLNVLKVVTIDKERYYPYIQWVIMVCVAGVIVYLNWNSNANIIRNENRKPYYTGSTANYLGAIDWIKNDTPPDSVIISDRAPWVYMLSERKTLTFPWVDNVEEVMDSMIQNRADYVIITPVGGYSAKYLVPVLNQKPEMFQKVYEKGDCIVYKLLNS